MKKTLLIFYILLSTVFTISAFAEAPDTVAPIVRMYPNPATSFINLDLGTAVNRGYTLEVYSFLGRKMYQVTDINQRITLNLTEYNRGVYIYQLRDRSGKLVETGKFQVSK